MLLKRPRKRQVIYRFEDLEKRRRSGWILSGLVILTLGVGIYVTMIPAGAAEPIKPLFGDLSVLRIGLLVLVGLLSLYIVRGEIDNTLLFFLSDNGANAESGPNGRLEGAQPGAAGSTVFLATLAK